MTYPLQSRTRLQIRQAIGYNLLGRDFIVSDTSSSAANTTTMSDTYMLAKGGTKDYVGRQVQINTLVTGGTPVGERSFVSSFTSPTLTISPGFTIAVKVGQDYELWKDYNIEQINDYIDQAVIEATKDIFVDYQTITTAKEKGLYRYALNSSFDAIHTVEYCSYTEVDEQLHSCDSAWDESTDSDATVTADTTMQKEGNSCLKVVVADGASANDVLVTDDITSVDISDCNEIVLWIYCTVAQAAGDLQILLDDTASCGSALESLNIPACVANTWHRHTISLANPDLDTAIISIGLKMVTDNGAETIYLDDIRAQHSASRRWTKISPDAWFLVLGSTNYLQLNQSAYNLIPNNSLIRVSGYKKPTILTADTTTADIDPDYIVAKATALALASRGGGNEQEAKARLAMANYWMAMAEDKKRRMDSGCEMNTRWL